MAHRNAKGGGSIRQRPDGRWEGRYSLGFDPKTGHQRQRSVYGKTQAEVRKKLSKIVVEIDEGTYVCPTKMTLTQWLQTWLEDYTINVKPFTKKAYEDRCRLYIIPNLGRVKLAALTPTMIQRFINSLSVDRDDQKALAPKTIKNIHGVLHRALWQAEILGYLKNNPADNCLLPKVVKPPITPLTDKSLVDFIEVASESKYDDIFLIDLYTGLRQSEILGLTWDCVSFETGIITVKAQLQREKKKGGKYYLTSLKNDKTRYVAAAPTVIDLLRKRKEKQDAEREAALDLWYEPIPGLVFENEFGGFLSHTTIRKHFKRVVNKIGMPESRFHDLRHSFAVLCIECGIDVKTVQDSMGHHSSAFTLDTYGFVSQKMRTESALKMQRAIDSLTDKS